MKKLTIVLTFFVFHFSFSTLTASTIITGPTASGHWTLAGSPYLIQNSVYVPNDSTLLIDPGVTVNFQTAFTPYIHVLGRLLAIGTPSDSIYFTATDTTDGFHGIRFYGILSSNDTSKLEYCKIQYGKANGSNYYVQNGGALLFDNWSKAIVSHCYISNCLTGASYSYGGAICCDSGSSPVITYNTITRCISFFFGGGISASNSSTPVMSYNTITGNSANHGGGIEILNAQNYSISHNTILYNSGFSGGGGICMSSSKGIISENSISYNSTGYGPGGGIYDIDGDSLFILNNTISYNVSDPVNSFGYYAGGIDCQSTNMVTIDDNIISDNSASNGGNGGGIYFAQALLVTVSNNSIVNNTAVYSGGSGDGGAIFCDNTSPLLINNTIANNWAYDGGGLYCDLSSNPVSRNCIYWGDTATNSGNELFQNDQPSTPNYYYCNVQGGQAAFGLNGNFYFGIYANNVNGDPTFVSPSGGKGTAYDGVSSNWALQNGSPCIDTGDPLYSPYPSTDLGGNPRIVVCRIDMGAYENQYGVSSPLQISISGSNSLCFGDSTSLSANGASSFSWSPSTGLSCTNCPNPVAKPTVTTTYTVIGTSGVCEAMDTIKITVNPLPILTIGNNLDTLKISGAKTYLWSTGSTNDTAIVYQQGTYYVTATDSNGCASKDSITIISTTISNTADKSRGITVYPIPSKGNINVVLNGTGFISMKVIDELGREIYSRPIDEKNKYQDLNVNLGKISNGVYILQVTTGNGIINKRIIVQK